MIDSGSSVFSSKNMYLFGVLSIFLTVYGPRLHQKLPNGLRILFTNRVFRAGVLFAIAYISSKDIQSAIVITLVFIITMNLFHTSKLLEKFESESFVINGQPVAKCDVYDRVQIDQVGTAFYPINTETANLEKDSLHANEAIF